MIFKGDHIGSMATRSLIKAMLRPVRPLVRPFVVRLRFFLASSMDLSSCRALVMQCRQDLTEIHDQLQGIEHSLAAISGWMKDASVKAEATQLSLDAVRLRQQEEQFVGAERRSMMGEMRAAQVEMATALAAEIRSIATRQLDEDRLAKAAISKGDVVLSLIETLIARADLLVARVALPLGSDILMRVPEGLALVPGNDGALIAAIWEGGGQLEPGTLRVAVSLLRDGDKVADIGANIGLLTIPMGRKVGQTGHIFSVEPSSRIAELLRRSAFLNFGPNRVTVHCCAAGRSAGSATLNHGETAGHSSLLQIASVTGQEEVRVARLDDLIPPRTKLRLIKIDVEGLEIDVWAGMSRILNENPEVAVIVEFGPEHLRRANISIDAWLQVFFSANFSAYEIHELDGALAPLRALDLLEHVPSMNILLLRQPVSSYPGLVLQ